MKPLSPRRAATATAVAVAGAMILGPAAVAQADVPAGGLVAEYLFAQDSGAEVPNTAPGSTLGAAVVNESDDADWTGTALALRGGAKDSGGNWVELPDDILAGAEQATVVAEVKASQAMLDGYHFLWNIGSESSATEYFFATLNCANGRAPLVGIKSGGAENLVQSSSCGVTADRWVNVASVVDADGSAALYIDGALAAEGSVGFAPGDVVDQSVNTIGRSPWPDPLFEGAVSAFRVYDRALGADEVAALSADDAERNHAEILAEAQSALDGLDEVPSTVDDDYLALPSAGGELSWASSDESVIAADGRVTQPEQGSDPVTVTLTATAVIRGIAATADFDVEVLPSTATAEQRAAQAAERYAVPSVVADGAALPEAPDGLTVTPIEATGVVLDGGALTLDGGEAADATVTVEIARESAPDVTVAKTFDVTVLPGDEAARLVAYHRTPTSEQEANNADIALSMHLALSSGDEWTPLNENYGIFFPKTSAPLPASGPSSALIRSLTDPAVFAMSDGGYGIVATRVARGGGHDGTQADSVLVATSEDLRSYDEVGMLRLDEAGGVNEPTAVYDSADDVYRVSWTTDSGAERHQSFADLAAAVEQDEQGQSASGRVTGTDAAVETGIDDLAAGVELTVPQGIADGLVQRFGRVSNTGYAPFDDVSVEAGSEIDAASLPASVALDYSDGSTRELPLGEWDLAGVDTSTSGTYEAAATVKRADYPTPFADERADPSAYRYDVGGETRYLMVATNDPNLDVVNQRGAAFLPIRSADTLAGLADDADPTEVHLLDRGDVDAHGGVMTGCFWAPELHEIDGRLSILFMPCYGESPDYMNGRASIMQLAQDANGDDLDPMDPDNWSTPEHVTRADGSDLNAVSGISLDMTFFTDADGQAYYAWQQVCATWIATVDPTDPTRVTSEPVMIVEPEYAWDNVCAEGPNVHTRDGELLLIYSGSSVGNTYTTGLATAAAGGTDLTDPGSWQKLNYPLQKSGLYDGEWQLGTGHGMWSEDEDGNLIYVFHARTDHNGLTGRDMFVRRVHFDAEGMPVMDMERDEELADETVRLTVTVVGSGADVSAEASTRCIAGSAYVVVAATNDGEGPADIEIATPYGARTLAGVDPGERGSVAISSRQPAIDGGAVTVTADGAPVEAAYDAVTCG
ncbi:family 43 glycosylhydrolase [Microbacterium karelineae]|uniref:family 43 glycosylhydrolase n=1 Tax=Microbacterium karelineae TaxID=2654283 RepID=UPI0018D2D54A|nr:family 43 glycosylhydrolase [Microbacterium karelineae]